MDRSEKQAVVAALSDRLSRANAVVVTDFSGLKVDQLTELRAKLKATGQEYLVVKNTLFRLASQGTPAEELGKDLVGPNGLGFGFADPVELAKTLTEFAKTNPKLEIKGALLEGKLIDSEGVKDLAKLPPKEVLLAQLLGVMNGVARNFVSVLAAVPRGLVTALQAIADQKGEGAAPQDGE